MTTHIIKFVLIICFISLVYSRTIHENARLRRSSSKPAPKKFTTNPSPGSNMDKALGMKPKANGTNKVKKYPWDNSNTKNTAAGLSYTDFMKSFIKDEEEQFRDDYYEDYDFEFPKGGMRNDNFESKKNKDMAKRLGAIEAGGA